MVFCGFCYGRNYHVNRKSEVPTSCRPRKQCNCLSASVDANSIKTGIFSFLFIRNNTVITVSVPLLERQLANKKKTSLHSEIYILEEYSPQKRGLTMQQNLRTYLLLTYGINVRITGY
uniref:Uncharacterized protein n=1 Tax=Heterorhabditis bacteriophora TaxID=37862 RepID=A0A1I7WZX1_HETBA